MFQEHPKSDNWIEAEVVSNGLRVAVERSVVRVVRQAAARFRLPASARG